MASPKSRPRDGYPGRALSLILVVAVALVAIMFAKGYTTPHLGVDLAGGTSITLQASPPPGAPKSAVNGASLNEAKAIMNKRVNAFGVSEAQVQTQGNDTLVVTIPKGTDPSQIEAEISKTALLYFRPVLATAPSGVAVTPTPSGTASATSSSTASAPAAKAPSATASSKKQGDALTRDLTAATPSTKSTAKSTAPAKAATTPVPSAVASAPAATQSLTTGTVPADLLTAFNKLDCSNETQRSQDYQHSQTADAIACDIDPTSGVYYKYALGPVAVPGTDITNAAAGVSQSNGEWEVNLTFNSHGTSAFAKTTTTLSKNTDPQNRFAILLDGGVESAPSVSTPILGGQAEISGSFTQKTANDLATVLNAGALPLTLTKQDVTTVSPELGSSQLKAGLISGAIGLALVILYSMLYYRGLGLVAIAGLAVSAVLTYSIMCLLGGAIGFALNLPAICGAIVAIGITADSFVVYFERIRDELRHGTSLRPSVQRAWPKARRTILVADFVSFLAAAVLYFFTVGKVQGFAFTLGLTTLLDVVVIFLFTKPLITLLARRAFFADGHPLSGLDPKRLGVRPPLRGGRQSAPATPKEA